IGSSCWGGGAGGTPVRPNRGGATPACRGGGADRGGPGPGWGGVGPSAHPRGAASGPPALSGRFVRFFRSLPFSPSKLPTAPPRAASEHPLENLDRRRQLPGGRPVTFLPVEEAQALLRREMVRLQGGDDLARQDQQRPGQVGQLRAQPEVDRRRQADPV